MAPSFSMHVALHARPSLPIMPNPTPTLTKPQHKRKYIQAAPTSYYIITVFSIEKTAKPLTLLLVYNILSLTQKSANY